MKQSVAKFLMLAIGLMSLNACNKEASSQDFFCYGTSFININNSLTMAKEEKRTYSVSEVGITDYQCNFSEKTILCRKDIGPLKGSSTQELIINREFNFVVEVDTSHTVTGPAGQSSQTIYEAKCDKSFL